MANKLINESSPYLLQHAHNPVDWYPWGEEALTKAKKEDKPILVSIGYSACHWCHVMERESFEDTQTAALMNHSFVNIKIDREERPDLDHIYMDAVQTMTGSGGWPLNVFLTPEGKPFYGGTYFPPGPVHNRPSWKDVLFSIAKYFKEKRPEIETQSESITTHLKSSNTFGIRTDTALDESSHSMFNAENLDLIYKNLMSHADRQNGGFGLAPKFPQTFGIRFLLHYFYFTKKEDALEHACKSIEKMIRGGIYDQIGGGFARYSTDNFWLVPHFEKMLYDNALLIIVMAEAFQVTHKKEYAETIVQCMNFLQIDFMSFEYGWYAAFDADSEGEEGKYYIWTKKDVQSALGKDAETFCDYYGITENGNWEGSNILHVAIEKQAFVRERQLDPEFLDNILQKGRKALLDLRYQREAPAKDDKILLSWNALMVEACCKAYGVLGIEDYKDLAVKSMTFILNKFTGDADNLYFHSYKNGVAKIPAFLDDYSYLVSALIQIQEITGDEQYLIEAKRITEWVLEHFGDEKNGFFYYTHKGQQDIVVRKKEIYDGAVPSGNSVMSFKPFLPGYFI